LFCFLMHSPWYSCINYAIVCCIWYVHITNISPFDC
jgi:hypothetical protein